ncbi:uncharacterized protein DDB_G0271670-like [Sardina pilchardus]|uniref:uncharacterized protein DDB_G0271670-like n=1 Tax=Sardina pilchardus TaxID=27697 RepID=UPI002E118AEA
MKLQQVLCLCVLLVAAWATEFEDIGGGVRGNRPVEHSHKSADACETESWPMCTDGDWGPKCPSGCRIQGLLDKTDHDLLGRIDKIRQLLDDNRQKYRSTDQSSKQTYDYLRDRLTTSSGDDNKYMSLAESLRQRIVDIKIKIERQLNILEAFKSRIRDQVIEMQRLEVDIDMKLRNCKGSCAEYAEFSADRESYVAIDKQLDQLESIRVNSVERVGALRVMKSRQLKEVVVPSIYKSGLGAEEQKQYFTDVGQTELTLQGEGGTTYRGGTAPLTASSSHPHSSSSSSPHSSSSSSSSSHPHSSSSSSPHSSSSSSSHFSSSSSPHSSSSFPHSSSSSSSYPHSSSSSSSSSFPHSSSSSSSYPHSSSSSSSSFPHSSSSSLPHSSSSSSSHFSSSGFPDSSSSSSSHSSSFPHSSSSSSSSFPHSSSSSSSFPDSSASSTSHSSTSTHSTKCTRTVRKVIHHTKDGPVERVEEVLSGEGCDAMGGGDRSMTAFTHGGAADFFGGDVFKRFGSAFDDMSSPFGSAGSTKTMESTGMSSTKSLLSGTKTGSASGRGDADDLPDIFARG